MPLTDAQYYALIRTARAHGEYAGQVYSDASSRLDG